MNDDDSCSTTTETMLTILPNGRLRRRIMSWARGVLLGNGFYGMVHEGMSEDIKCANILVHANGSVKLSDFGLAKEMAKFNMLKSCKNIHIPVSLHSHATSVPIFHELNFFDWSEQVQFHLGVLDLDLALQVEKPAAITNASGNEERAHYKACERSNRLSLMFMRMSIANNIKSALPKTESAKEFMEFVKERSQTADKSLAGTLMGILTTMKFDGSRTMHEHVIEMTNIAARLKSLGMEVDENFLVQFILNSLPSEYGPFQMNYNTMKDKWNVHELHSMLAQEETRLKNQGNHSIHYVNHQGAGKKIEKRHGKGKGQLKICESSAKIQKKESNKNKCHFCGKFGHFQKDCQKRKAWFEKKGKLIAYVCLESNLTEVPHNTWWLDSGGTTHVSNTMQGFLTIQTISPNEKFVLMGNRVKVPVEAVGTYRLILDTGHHLDLYETLYVPSISRNLVSVSKLDVAGYYFKFGNGCFSLYKHTYMIGSAKGGRGLLTFFFGGGGWVRGREPPPPNRARTEAFSPLHASRRRRPPLPSSPPGDSDHHPPFSSRHHPTDPVDGDEERHHCRRQHAPLPPVSAVATSERRRRQ
ncbi:hypothetical protein ZIOFF_020670 [Zingiber officinale]|uniref:CCHC-type domain-containing protein n=1 Tax=Zingiber officinale TaxID=94328 RepID=A0A8J5HHT7_ZINOF|nr:hypothetical protein ZIOFF_020670 [Zingiber officinale]